MPNDIARRTLVLAVTAVALLAGSAPALAQTSSSSSSASDFFAAEPSRVLDTRSGHGAPAGRLPAGGTLDVVVTGLGGVPKSGVTAVVLNVTLVGATGETHLTVWPTGTARPTASTVNGVAGTAIANAAVVKVGTGGKVSVYSPVATHVLLDVTGWFGSGSGGARFRTLSPNRVVDTRSGLGGYQRRIRAHEAIEVVLTGSGGIPSSGVTAVAVTLTALNASGPTHLTVWGTGSGMPETSTLNVNAGDTVASNAAISGITSAGRISIYNHSGSVDVTLDVAGWFGPGSTGTRLRALDPSRLADSRSGLGVPIGKLGPGGTASLKVTGAGGVPASGVTAVVLNVTAVRPSALTYLTTWPSGETRPVAATLAAVARRTKAGLVIAKVGTDGRVLIRNVHGSTDLVVDVVGWFGTASSSSSSS